MQCCDLARAILNNTGDGLVDHLIAGGFFDSVTNVTLSDLKDIKALTPSATGSATGSSTSSGTATP